MNKLLLVVFAMLSINSSWAQKNNLDFTKNASIDKGKQIVVYKDIKDKYYYYQKIERALMKAGYSVAENNVGESHNNQSAYYLEYHIGSVAKKGKDDFGMTINLFEEGSGKMIAMGNYVGHDKNAVLSNLDTIIKQFIDKLGEQ